MTEKHSHNRLLPVFLFGLCMSGCTHHVREQQALVLAAGSGDLVRVEKLIKQGSDPNVALENGTTPLLIASQRGHIDIVKRLLDSGVSANVSGRLGATALILATTAGHKDIVALLIERGVQIDMQRRDGATALYMAAQNGNHQIVLQLLAAGAEINKTAYWNATALFIAAQTGHSSVVKILAQNGADIDAVLPSGKTPLQAAVEKNQIDVVRILLGFGAEVDRKNSAGIKLVELAESKGNTEMVKLLERESEQDNIETNDNQSKLTVAESVQDQMVENAQVEVSSSLEETKMDLPRLTATEKPAAKPLLSVPVPAPGKIQPSKPKIKYIKPQLATKPAVDANLPVNKSPVPEDNLTVSTNSDVPKKNEIPDTELEDPAFNNDPSSFGWSAEKFINSVNSAPAPAGRANDAVTNVDSSQVVSTSLSDVARRSDKSVGNNSYLAALEAENDADSVNPSPVSSADVRSPDTLLATGVAHYFRKEYKQAASEFLALYKAFPASEKAADGLLHLGKSLAALNRTEASCSTIARLRKEYPKSWPRLASDAGNLSKQNGCP
jgi:ankyrin repeat protein